MVGMTGIARRFLPTWLRRRLAGWLRRATRGRVRFGSLRRLTPLSREFGFDRGQPIDRYYIERFLEENASAIRGRVLEVGTSMYTRRFGGDRVSASEVLHVSETKLEVTLIGDLTDPDLPLVDCSFDCVILTQVLQFIDDVPGAVRNVARLLRPGGELLVTVPGISPISAYDMDRWGDHWRFTSRSFEDLLRREFPDSDWQLETHGNVLAATAFLYGLAADELEESELDHVDSAFQVMITARLKKSR